MSNPGKNASDSSSKTTTNDHTAPVPRSKVEAVRDLHYLIRLCRMHQRLHDRLDRWTRLLELLGGSAALVAVVGQSPAAIAVAGLLLAVVAFGSLVFAPSTRARQYHEAALALADVLARSDGLSLAGLDARRFRIPLPTFVDGLRMPCYNDTMLSLGLGGYALPLNRWQRFMAAVA